MGPVSTAEFYREIIRQCQKQYGAKYDEDYPEIFIYNLPIPDVVEGLKTPEKTLEVLVNGAKKLASIGIDFMTIPCNTVQYFYEDIQAKLEAPLLNIVKESAMKLKSLGYSKIGILATETTIKTKLYEKIFSELGITLFSPQNQSIVNNVILNILAGKRSESDKNNLLQIITELKEQGAEAVLLGCTDLSFFLEKQVSSLPIYDSTIILAEMTVKYAITSNSQQDTL
jgi:aspartate racemase|tara:strand:+ start:1002 stop:1682 length:681 start_codon:yes stop_codon:yes gene_type:complete